MIKHRNIRGFTLVEVIIYVGLVSLLATAYVIFSFDVLSSTRKARVQQEVQQNGRFAIERILQEIRAAEGVNVGSSTFGSHPGILSLATAVPATNPTIFDVSGGVLRIKRGAAAAEALTSDEYQVSNLVFTDLSVSTRTANIRVSLTLAHPNPNALEIFNASSTHQGSAVVREIVD